MEMEPHAKVAKERGIDKNERRVFIHFMVSYDRSPRFLFPWRPLRTLREISSVQLHCSGFRRRGNLWEIIYEKYSTDWKVRRFRRLKPGLQTMDHPTASSV